MEEIMQEPRSMSRRRKKQLAPWERMLRKYWPPVRLLLLGAIAISLVVLLISCAVAVIV